MGALVVAMAVVVGGMKRVDELCVIRNELFLLESTVCRRRRASSRCVVKDS